MRKSWSDERKWNILFKSIFIIIPRQPRWKKKSKSFQADHSSSHRSTLKIRTATMWRVQCGNGPECRFSLIFHGQPDLSENSDRWKTLNNVRWKFGQIICKFRSRTTSGRAWNAAVWCEIFGAKRSANTPRFFRIRTK